MTVQTLTPVHSLAREQHASERRPERVECVQLQEQVTSPLPRRSERKAAEALSERLAGSGAVAHAAPMFVP